LRSQGGDKCGGANAPVLPFIKLVPSAVLDSGKKFPGKGGDGGSQKRGGGGKEGGVMLLKNNTREIQSLTIISAWEGGIGHPLLPAPHGKTKRGMSQRTPGVPHSPRRQKLWGRLKRGKNFANMISTTDSGGKKANLKHSREFAEGTLSPKKD